MKVLTGFLLVAVAYAGFFDREVNYFNLKQEEKVQKEDKQRREYYRKVWEETENWFPPNVSPIERELYKNPTDPVLQQMYVRYIEKRTLMGRYAGQILQEYSRTKENALKALGSAGVELFYFYSPACPYCKMSEPTVYDLSLYIRVNKLRVESPNPKIQELIQLFGVRATPTLVAVQKNRVLGIWEGAFTWDNARFLDWIGDLLKRVALREGK